MRAGVTGGTTGHEPNAGRIPPLVSARTEMSQDCDQHKRLFKIAQTARRLMVNLSGTSR
jgi:hypothetical protein